MNDYDILPEWMWNIGWIIIQLAFALCLMLLTLYLVYLILLSVQWGLIKLGWMEGTDAD